MGEVFDCVQDVLFDPMHVFFSHGTPIQFTFPDSLAGLVQNLQLSYNAPLGLNMGREKEDRIPHLGGVRTLEEKASLDAQTHAFPKTPSMKASRFPYRPSTRMQKFKGAPCLCL
jgi:hypothetical protein